MPRKKGAGEGRWRSIKTGRYVNSYYGKRNPHRVTKEESKPQGEEHVDPDRREE